MLICYFEIGALHLKTISLIYNILCSLFPFTKIIDMVTKRHLKKINLNNRKFRNSLIEIMISKLRSKHNLPEAISILYNLLLFAVCKKS